MIEIKQLKLPIDHTKEQLQQKLCRLLRVKPEQLLAYQIVKQSIDARKKPELYFVYQVSVSVEQENKVLARIKDKNISIITSVPYTFQVTGDKSLHTPPVIVGSGPAGLFCAYMLASNGYAPIVLERGEEVEARQATVNRFWETGELNTESNVQFGEGGAGTFSDGKLNTLVKDPSGKNKFLLETFIKFGAPEEIRYQNKPHLGTDILIHIVKNMREEIIRLGGKFLFLSKLTNVQVERGNVCSITINDTKIIPVEILVLAVGHSARDTFTMLHGLGMEMEQKSFAVGVRIEHPQQLIDMSQYGSKDCGLPAADYKLSVTLPNERSVYSFCMCPGGYVVNASSEQGRLAINGMSYQARDGRNANSALVVTVTPQDYESNHPLAGVAYQRALEEKAFQSGNGKIPVQLYGDFMRRKHTEHLKQIQPEMKGAFTLSDIRQVLPNQLCESICEAIEVFGRKIKGFNREDAILSAVESRTSSPLRIKRDENFESNIRGIYPCGEGAGYAGGITSAGMDGMRIAETIAACYKNQT